MNRLRIPVAPRPRKLRSVEGLGSGPEGRIEKLRKVVTKLFRHERIEGSFRILDESRGYAELLIQQACLHGPQHPKTMEMADFWLLEKDLVHKLFKELAPRYQSFTSSYTSQFTLPTSYPTAAQRVVLELKGNPWPAVIQNQTDTSKWINNILLDSARKNLGQGRINEALDIDRTEAEMSQNPDSPAL